MKKPLSTKPAELRRQAEALHKQNLQESPPLTKVDSQRLVHELQVHQIELELQKDELHKTQAEVEAWLERYTELYDFAPVGYFSLALDGMIQQVNLSGSTLLNVERSRLVGSRFGLFVANNDRSFFNSFLANVYESRVKETCEVMIQKEGADPIWVLIEANITMDGLSYRTVVMDISQQKQVEGKLQHLYMHDALTGIYNRGYFEEAILQLEHGRQYPISILMVDVDRLKVTNDNEGHAAGDALLKRTADLLTTAFRAEDVVARIGGDEFAVLLPNTNSTAAQDALRRCYQILHKNNTACGGTPLLLSFGLATAEIYTSIIEAIKAADFNMYHNKRKRRILFNQKNPDLPVETTQLRLRAETLHKEFSQEESLGTETDANRLVEELHVHQLELEIQNEELIQAREIVETYLERYTELYDFAPAGYFNLSLDGTILQVNLSGASLLKEDRSRLVGSRFGLFVAERDRIAFSVFLNKVFESQTRQTCEVRLQKEEDAPPGLRLAGSSFLFNSSQRVVHIEAEATANGQDCRAFVIDITPQKQAEEILKTESELLHFCYYATSTQQLMQEIIPYLKQMTGCEAVGVRLHKGVDFPYYITQGFPETFVEAERSLCALDSQGELLRDSAGNPVLECMCGNIICGRFDPTKPFFTKHGSFWSNSTSELLASTSEADRQARTRNRCNGEGYESVALIPLRALGKTFGLFQFNDKRRGRFSLKIIEWLEHLVDTVAFALSNLEAAQELEEGELRYRELFDHSPIPTWVEDFSLICQLFEQIRASGVTDMRAYFSAHPEQVIRCAELLKIVDVNGTSLTFFDVAKKEDIPLHLPDFFGESSWQVFREEIIALAEGAHHFNSDIPIRNLKGEEKIVSLHLSVDPNHIQTLSRVLVSFVDITSSKQAEKKLQENTDRLNAIINTSLDGFFICSQEGKFLEMNDAFAYILGYNKRELMERSLAEIEVMENPEDIAEHVKTAMVAGSDRFESCYQCKDGRIINVEISSTYSRLNDVFLVFVRDIDLRKQATEAMQKSETRFRTLAALVPVGIYLTDPAGSCLYANNKWLETAGLSIEQAQGGGWSEALHPDDRSRVFSEWQKMVESRGKWGSEYRFLTPDGKTTWVYGLATELADEHGSLTGYIGANMDITERKLMEDNLQASVVEKDVLLREVHHRVKNNLASILGLLEMERQGITDPDAESMLIDLGNRIKSMATIHEKLYRSDNLSKIDFQDYLKSFTSHLRTSFSRMNNLVCQVDAPGVELSLDTAVPCGLIVNEMVTNAMKHAFPQGKPGSPGDEVCKIAVSMKQNDSIIILEVSDNGAGFPEDLDWRSAKTLGLRLVRMLGEHQLGGKMELDRSNGTHFTLTFKNQRKHQV